MKTLSEMRQHYVAISDRARGMIQRAKKEGRDLSNEENQAFQKLHREMQDLEGAIEARAIIQGAQAAEFYREITQTDAENHFAHRAQQKAQANAFYRFAGEAVREMIRTGVQNVSDLREVRGILSSNSAGTISEVVMDQSYTASLAAHMPLADYGLVLDDNTGNFSKFPYEAGSLTPTIAGEASAIDSGALTIGSYPVNLTKFAVIQRVSMEVAEDYPAVFQHIAQSASTAFSRRISQYVFDRVATTSGVQAIDASGLAASAFNWDSISTGMALLTAADVNPSRAAFCCSPKYGAHFSKLKATGDGQYLMRPAPLANMPFETTSAIVENGTTRAFLADWSNARLIVKGIGASVFNGGTRFRAEQNSNVVSPGAIPVQDLFLGSGELGVLYYLRCDIVLHRPNAFVIWDNLTIPS